MSVSVETNEHEIKEGEREVERDLGHAEAEIEHHDEKLGEHEEHITNVKDDIEWMKGELARLTDMILALPAIPIDQIEELQHGLRAAEERLENLEGKAATAAVTELPDTVENEVKEPERKRPLHHLAERLF